MQSDISTPQVLKPVGTLAQSSQV